MIAERQESAIADINGFWKDVLEQVEADTAKLYREDGSKIFSDKEHGKQMTALEQVTRKRADKVIGEYQAVIDACDSALGAMNLNPLLQVYDATQRSEASYKAPFIKEDCSDMPLPALTARLDAVSKLGGNIDRLLYARYARQRLNTGKDDNELGYIECMAALRQLEGDSKPEERKTAERIRNLAERRYYAVNADLYRMFGDSSRDSGKSFAQRTF